MEGRARPLFRRLGILLAVATAALAYSGAASAATFVVNTFDDVSLGSCDALHCNLREAMTAANANPGADLIAFNIVGPPPHSIKPLTQLPFITGPVTIDGTTEPGFAGSPIVEVDGTLAGVAASGFVILAGASTIRGLVINHFDHAGIHMQQGGGNRVAGNYIGTDFSGTLAAENRFAGVDIFGADDNVVGGTTALDRNLISGNVTDGTGVEIRSGVAEGIATGNMVLGNYIGTDVTGMLPLGNAAGGVIVGGNNNTIGGTSAGARNVISGNRSNGVVIGGSGNIVQGNYVGVNVSGNAPLGNLNGIEINNGANNLVGGTLPGAGNVISGNRQEGLQIANAGATGNRVQGNFIGTDATGTVGLGNGPGFRGIVIAFGPTSNTIGGTSAAARNIISANGVGIWLATANTTGNLVQGNYIGTDVAGTSALPNRYGVQITADFNTIGGATPGAGNLISGNQFFGIEILGGRVNLVQGNLIGTRADGTSPLGNGDDGVIIRGNGTDNTIGGLVAGAGNTIAFNGANGVEIESLFRNPILTNSIHSNTRLGIDLSPFGPTLNDPSDADTGANELQNFPVIASASSSGGTTTVNGSLSSKPSTTYLLQFFANAACDPLLFGEGQEHLADRSVTTDATGTATFSFSFGSGSVGNVITATATDPLNNTSEFSSCLTAPVGPGPPATLLLEPAADENPVRTEHCVTATVRDAAGNPTPNVIVRFAVTGANTASGSVTTDANGQARFCYTGQNVGEDAIRAFADTDGDGTEDPGEPFGVAAKTWTPAAPATLVLDPKLATNPTGTQHCVTATVRDAFGNPVPGVIVRFQVTGAHMLSGQVTTDANGQARFCYTGTQAGEDAIRAFADSDGDGTEDTGEPADTATKTWTSTCPRGDDDRDDDGLDDDRESLFGSLLNNSDSDDGVRDGNEDSDDDGEDDEDEDDDDDPCPEDDDGDGEDDDDEDDDDDDD